MTFLFIVDEVIHYFCLIQSYHMSLYSHLLIHYAHMRMRSLVCDSLAVCMHALSRWIEWVSSLFAQAVGQTEMEMDMPWNLLTATTTCN